MPLNFTARGKASPSQPQNQPTPSTRPQVTYNQPSPSSARVAALKEKLANKPTAQPQAPRRAGSSARAEEFSKLQKYSSTPQPQAQAGVKKNIDLEGNDLGKIAPPPSGLAGGAELSPLNNDVEPQAPPVEATNKPLSAEYVALSKKEKAVRRAQQELKAERELLQQEKAGFVSKKDLQSDPFKALSEAGVTYDRLVELQLNQAAPDPNQALLAEIADLKAQLNGVNEQFTKRDTQAYNAAVNQIRNDVKLLVDSDPSFETIKATGQSEEVVELIKRVFNDEGDVLPVEVAAQLVEEKLLDREYERFQKLSALAKIKSRMAPPAESAEASNVQPHPLSPKQTTLTNAGAVQRPLTPRERAILAVERKMANKE